jgi:hypothetical protein
VIKLLMLLIVLGVVGWIGYHWYESNTGGGTPTGGYHGVRARRYESAYRICNRAVSNGQVNIQRLRALHLSARYHQIELQGCMAGARKAGLGDILNQLKQQLP